MKLKVQCQHAIAFVSEGQCANACLDKNYWDIFLPIYYQIQLSIHLQGSTVNFKLTWVEKLSSKFKIQGIGIPSRRNGATV